MEHTAEALEKFKKLSTYTSPSIKGNIDEYSIINNFNTEPIAASGP